VVIPYQKAFNEFPLSIEFWVKLESVDMTQVLIERGPTGPGYWALCVTEGGHVVFDSLDITGHWLSLRSNQIIAAHHWHFISLCLREGRVSLAVDGKTVTDKDNARKIQPTESPIVLGNGVVGNHLLPMRGILDNLRISKGIRDPDAVPVSALTKDETTILLLDSDR
jgi:hypothetical protein